MNRKSIFVLTVFVAFAAAAFAQNVTLQVEPEGKAFTKSYQQRFIGSDGQSVVLVQNAGRRKDKMELVRFDMQQNELGRVMIGTEKERDCYGGFVNGQHIDLLECTWKNDGMQVFRDRRSLQTLEREGDSVPLANFEGTKGDKMGLRLITSPNQELLACIYAVARESQNTEVQVALYSRELEEYWKMDTRHRRFDLLYLTDSGEVLLGYYSGKEFSFTLLDGEKETSFEFPCDIAAKELTVARFANGKLQIVGTHPSQNHLDAWGTNIDQLISVCYDMKSRRVNENRYVFDQLDINRLDNEKDSYKIKKDNFVIGFGNLLQTIADKDGCYAMVDQMWTTRDEYGRGRYFDRCGMFVARINKDGSIAWTRSTRLRSTVEFDESPMISHQWVKTRHGIMLLWMTDKKSRDLPIEKPIKNHNPLDAKGILVVQTYDAQGNEGREYIEIPSKHGILGYPHRLQGDEFMLLLRGKSKCEFATLKVN